LAEYFAGAEGRGGSLRPGRPAIRKSLLCLGIDFRRTNFQPIHTPECGQDAEYIGGTREPVKQSRVNMDTPFISVPTRRPLNILVVDDHVIMREVVCEILEDAGHVVRSASDGHGALRELSSGDFDLMVTDIVMPEMDGIELISEVRRRSPDTRIIAMSGGGERFPTNDGLMIAQRVGAGLSLNKPFGSDELLAAVGELYPPQACAV
jgi:CheY-like chemotaxis protein